MFKVSKRFRRKGIPIYRLIDLKDDEITGTFYQEELQKVQTTDIWKVEKILKEKGRGKNKMVYVKWFNEWIKASDLQDV